LGFGDEERSTMVAISAKNVLGSPLIPCSMDPLTGFYRDGCCKLGKEDLGLHLVCTQVTEEFLEYSKAAGNDLSTPMPMYNFAGLKPGDRWCLCVQRWKQALDAGQAAPVVLAATHISSLEFVDLEELQAHALDAAPESD
jgi:uncharacterized protein (DUF2237 family)